MIIAFELTQRIHCSPAVVFSFLSDVTNMPKWNYYIQRVSKVSEGAIQVGTIFELKRPHDLFYFIVVEFVPPNKITMQLQPPGPHMLYGFDLTACEGHTDVKYSWHLDLKRYSVLKYVPDGGFKNWLLSIVEKQILSKTKPAVEQNFFKLKALLETGEAVLQDGRRMTV